MTTEETLKAIQTCLGVIARDDADAIAKELERRGIKGVRGGACSCVLAEWVKQAIPELPGCVVVDPQPGVRGHGYLANNGAIILLSPAFSEMAIKFDKGFYPELVFRPTPVKETA